MRETSCGSDELKDIVDLQDIVINEKLSPEERINEFVRQIKNPYLYKVDDVVVKVSFSDSSISFEERLKQFLQSLQWITQI